MRVITVIIIASLVCGVALCRAEAVRPDSLITVSGIVKDRSRKKSLAGTSLSVPGSNIATITNADGRFSLKIPHGMIKSRIKAEHIGYVSAMFSGDGRTDITVWLDPSARMLEEVTVYGADPRQLIESAIKKIPVNYSASPSLFSSFYRETIQKGHRFIGVSEAMISVFKNSYKERQIAGDRVRIVKGRRLVSQRKSDTLAVKIMGGPTLPVALDVVKNENMLFSLPELDYYEFKMERNAVIDDRLQFVVSFRPKVKVDYALHKGRIYIDQETQSITRAEFSLDLSDREKATRAVLYKKPRGLRFRLQEVEFVVSYKHQGGVSYLDYIRSKTRFKCDWKRRLFSSGYTAYAEMVMVDRDDSPSESISRKEAFGSRDVFYDKVDDFSDSAFWKDYNIIEPTESLEKAVAKLRK